MSMSGSAAPEAADQPGPSTTGPADTPNPDTTTQPARPERVAPARIRGAWRLRSSWIVGSAVLLVSLLAGGPPVVEWLSVVFTDDAYVNGRVTLVAPRVTGKVVRVLVGDNNRVRKGQLLVQLDKEPYQVQVKIAQAAVAAAQADLVAAQAQVRGVQAQTRSLRFSLERAIEDVHDRIALLRSKVAILAAQKAALAKAQLDYDRVLPLLDPTIGGVTQVEAALQDVHQIRAGLGLPPKPATSDDLAQVPPDLDQTFSAVRQAQASLILAAAQLGVTGSFNRTPRETQTRNRKAT